LPAAGTDGKVREESHLDDMRSAIRGDFERLAERRGGQELMRAPEQEAEPEPEPGPELEPGAGPEPEPGDERLLEVPSDELPAAVEDAPPEQQTRRSLLDRLLGR
jgi:hypothetical protein